MKEEPSCNICEEIIRENEPNKLNDKEILLLHIDFALSKIYNNDEVETWIYTENNKLHGMYIKFKDKIYYLQVEKLNKNRIVLDAYYMFRLGNDIDDKNRRYIICINHSNKKIKVNVRESEIKDKDR